MARRRDINDIDDDEDGLVDYSGESDDVDKSKDILPEDAFRRHPAPDIGTVDTSQPHQYSIVRHGKKVDKTLTVHVELGKTSLNFRSRS